MIVVLAVAPGSAAPVRADALGSEVCLACHGEKGFAAPSGRSLFTDAAAFGGSAHGPFACVVCHTDVTEVPHADHLQPVRIDAVCATCHAEAVAAYRKSPHGRAESDGVTEAATCTDCHGPIHALEPHTAPDAAAHWTQMAATCARCHGNLELAEKFHIPVVRPVEAYLASVHAQRVATGERGAVCSDCHGSHLILPASDPGSSIARINISATCGQCHKRVLATYMESVHGEALARGHGGVPVCTDCHGEHRILGTSEPDSPVSAANLPGETCGRCHGDERLSRKYGLAVGNVAAFRDSFHGLALRAGQVMVANCASCHGVHDIRRSSDPRSHVNPANLPATCGKCHPGAGEAFALVSVHGSSTTTGTRVVAWVRSIYLWGIFLTIGLMSAHNLLDIGRKARRTAPPVRTLPAAQPERMTRGLRWQHGLVMLSFPVLAYTGFALTYPESWWAAPLLRWEATLGVRGAVHRTAAVVLVAALTWHVAHLATSARLRACLAGLWPTLDDLRALQGAVAYYLGFRATPPHGATFNYAEKAEYWAFMWGTAIMTATGVLLWFENASLRFLPAWLLEVATALHFYEAVLATLSILVWHFYWVIFDPDVYPMDWSWWDGRSVSRGHDCTPRPPAPDDEAEK